MSVALPNTIAYDPPAFINSTFEELKMPNINQFSVKSFFVLVLIVRTVPVATEYTSSRVAPASSKKQRSLGI
jgi:hypothetical protein